MLKKLFKHEFNDFTKIIRFAWFALLGVSVITSISFLAYQSLGNQSDYYNPTLATSLSRIFFGSTITLFGLAIVTVFILTEVMFVVRFYRSMLSSEGYLTHSLPFRADQMMNIKLITGVLVFLLDILITGAAICIVFLPSMIANSSIVTVWNDFWALVEAIFNGLGVGYTIILIIEGIIILLVSLLGIILYPVMCMSIGQRFKNRIIMSVVFYIGINWALEFIGTIAAITFSIAFVYTDTLPFINDNVGLTLTVWGAVALLVSCGISAAYYFISKHMLTKKLNLL